MMFFKLRLKRHIFPLPVIETKRLIFRPMTMDDLNDFYDLASLSKTVEHLPWGPHLNLFESKCFLESVIEKMKRFRYHEWGIELKSEKKLIGTFGYTELSHGGAEMGYILSPKYQKNGYMTEAMEYFVPYSFEVLNLKHLRLRIMEKNTPSRRLAEKFGFLLSEIKKDYMFIRGESRNVFFYYLYNKL